MPDWRSGTIAVVKTDERVEEAIWHVMRSCGVSTLNPAELPRYKLSCIDLLLKNYRYESRVYLTDIYGVVNARALRLGVNRDALFEKAWYYLSKIICSGVDSAECDGEAKLSCCARDCGGLCELAKFEAFAKRGIVFDLVKALEDALSVSQDL